MKFIAYIYLIKSDLSVNLIYYATYMPDFQRRAIARFGCSAHIPATKPGSWSHTPRASHLSECCRLIMRKMNCLVSSCVKISGLQASNPILHACFLINDTKADHILIIATFEKMMDPFYPQSPQKVSFANSFPCWISVLRVYLFWDVLPKMSIDLLMIFIS